MKQMKPFLSVSAILALVIFTCIIAGCLNSQPDTVTIITTPAPSGTGTAVSEPAGIATQEKPTVKTTIVQKTTVMPTTGILPSVTPAVSQTGVPPTQKLVSGSEITIRHNDFMPAIIVINPGTIVTLMNKDSVSNAIVSETGSPESFKSGTIPPGESYTFTLTKSGTYEYHLTTPYGPVGTIIVN